MNHVESVNVSEEESASHFGVCRECKHHDGYINIGREHWFYCRQHKTRWSAGSNLFSCWKDETEEEQRDTYEALEFGTFRIVGGC